MLSRNFDKGVSCIFCNYKFVEHSVVNDCFYYKSKPIFYTYTRYVCKRCNKRFFDRCLHDARHDAICKYYGVFNCKQIRAIREKYKLSAHDFASIIGVTELRLQRWERGDTIISKSYSQYLYLISFDDNINRINHYRIGNGEHLCFGG